MSENTAPARCSAAEWKMARDAGLSIFTTADEVAIHRFAEAIRAESAPAFKEATREQCDAADAIEAARAAGFLFTGGRIESPFGGGPDLRPHLVRFVQELRRLS